MQLRSAFILTIFFFTVIRPVFGAEQPVEKEKIPDVKKFRLVDKPVWEVGIGGGYFEGFDYPASKDPNKRTLVLPYFTYRSPMVRVSGGKLQAIAVENPRLKIDLSVGGSFNAKSEGNSARQDLPDLDFLFEFGPQIEYRLIDRKSLNDSRSKLSWDTYLRGVFSTDFSSIEPSGVILGTRLRFRQTNIFNTPVDFIARFGPVWTTRELQDYFYAVPRRFATAERPAYEAKSGYLGSDLFYGFAIRFNEHVRVFVANKVGFYSGAANQDSPLFEIDRSSTFLLGFVWSINQSKQRIKVVEDD